MSDISTIDSGGVDRTQLPQVQQKNLPLLVKKLREAGVDVQIGQCSPDKIKPMQNKVDKDKIKGMMEGDVGDKFLLISKGGNLIDGHHRYIVSRLKKDEAVKVIKIGLPIRKAINALNQWSKSNNKAIDEDWKFTPQKAGGMYAVHTPAADMSQLEPHDDKDALPDYKYTKDKGTKKTDNVIRKYHAKNKDQANHGYPYDRPANALPI